MTCAKCGETISPVSSAKTFRGKNYHPLCLESYKQALKETTLARDKKTAAKKPLDYIQLENYICAAFQIPSLSFKLAKQLEQMHLEWNCSWDDILKVARYWFEIIPKEKDLSEPTLGILPYYREEALLFWAGIEAANAYNDAHILQNKVVKLPYRTKPKGQYLSYRMEEL